jgi:hypothetical protein
MARLGPPIKGNRIDQGRMHAEKRSNHVHSPLIGGICELLGEADEGYGLGWEVVLETAA